MIEPGELGSKEKKQAHTTKYPRCLEIGRWTGAPEPGLHACYGGRWGVAETRVKFLAVGWCLWRQTAKSPAL